MNPFFPTDSRLTVTFDRPPIRREDDDVCVRYDPGPHGTIEIVGEYEFVERLWRAMRAEFEAIQKEITP